jgi:hypothetical protein
VGRQGQPRLIRFGFPAFDLVFAFDDVDDFFFQTITKKAQLVGCARGLLMLDFPTFPAYTIFVFTVDQGFVILSGAFCREGPMQLAGKYIGPSLSLRMTNV